MKYIIFEREFAGCRQRVPVVFPNYLVHKEVADAVSPVLGTCEVFSAGELNLVTSDFECIGGSSTLRKLAHPDDAQVIRMHDYFVGLVV